MRELRDTYDRVLISGCIGPYDDGYNPAERLSADAAEAYHDTQIATFATSPSHGPRARVARPAWQPHGLQRGSPVRRAGGPGRARRSARVRRARLARPRVSCRRVRRGGPQTTRRTSPRGRSRARGQVRAPATAGPLRATA